MNKARTTPLSLGYGKHVVYQGKRYIIRQESTNFLTVILYDSDTDNLLEAPIAELSPIEPLRTAPKRDLNAQNPKARERAERKYDFIKPLLDHPNHSTDDVKAIANKAGVHFTSIYNWLRDYATTGTISALIRKDRSDKGKTQISEHLNEVIATTIKIHLLTNQKKSVAKVITEVQKICAKEKIKPPHANTIRNRVEQLDSYQRLKAREGNKAARDKYALIKGHFPGADFPLSVTQIDHTLIDIILVDDIHRLPISRPWLTLLIDVFSRMVLGFYISFDPPGNLATGLCLAHAFLPKDKWMAKFGLTTQWPCWGTPKTVHLDNAKEFRGNMLKNACKEYGINLEWRPVKVPHYGGHIERLLGTLNKEIHNLPGSTFSNPKARGTYNSDKEAVMSISEFERCFTILCTEIYHKRKHSQLGMPPISKWEEGIFGTATTKAVGIPPIITDETRLKLDLMPYELRTVQPYGIQWDHIEYQSDVLRRWINSDDPDNPKLKRKFFCRRDPRDISSIWFYDPEVEHHYQIPYRNTSHPAVSIWEWRDAEKRAIEANPHEPVDENRIFDAYDRIQEIVDEAKKTTKAMRKNAQRKRMGVENAKNHLSAEKPPTNKAPTTKNVAARPKRVIKTYEIDDMQGNES